MSPMDRQGTVGGWIGAVFGMTVWLVLLAALAFRRNVGLGALLTVLCLLQIGAAVLLSRLRGAWGIHRTMGWFIGFAMPIAAAAFLAVDLAGEMAWLQDQASGRGLPFSPYWVLLVYPGLAIVFWWHARARWRSA